MGFFFENVDFNLVSTFGQNPQGTCQGCHFCNNIVRHWGPFTYPLTESFSLVIHKNYKYIN